MVKYIVTFRLADSPTYNDRYQKLDDFFEQNTSDIFLMKLHLHFFVREKIWQQN